MNPPNRYTTLIVGAGRFAGNYLRVMAGVNRMTRAGLGEFVLDPLVVTRTSVEKARQVARQVRHTYGDSFSLVAAEEVTDRHSLQEVLAAHRPGLICITARDRRHGDRIHVDYSRLGLDVGAVLCEKPFSATDGDGSSLLPLISLLQHPQAGRFGMHLPMAVVLPAMMRDPHLGLLLGKAKQIHFLWQIREPGGDLIDNVAVHPWSLIPVPVTVTAVERIEDRANGVRLAFCQQPPVAGRRLSGSILLQAGGTFRGMCADGTVLQFDFSDDLLHVRALNIPWQKILDGERCHKGADVILRIENPLRQHLISLLMGRPVVDMHYTLACQRFLESARRQFKTTCKL